MTTISAHIHEANERRNGTAIYNGLHWDVADMPALNGTSKQVAWAEKIRANGVHWAGEIIRRNVERRVRADTSAGVFDALNAELADAAAKLAAGIARKTDARWWIDNRDALDGPDKGAHRLIAA